jgi:hypothetical protein
MLISRFFKVHMRPFGRRQFDRAGEGKVVQFERDPRHRVAMALDQPQQVAELGRAGDRRARDVVGRGEPLHKRDIGGGVMVRRLHPNPVLELLGLFLLCENGEHVV